MEETHSWKEKIDPAFDELIKVYLDFIKNTFICDGNKNKRYLTLDNESLKVLEQKRYPPLLKKFKPNPRNLHKLLSDTCTLGASPDNKHITEFFKNLTIISIMNENKKSTRENTKEYGDALNSSFMSMVKGLPREDSRNYYKNRFETFFSPEKGKKDFNDFMTDVCCLMCQTGIRGYGDSQDKSCGDKKINKMNFINITMKNIYDAISIMTYKKTLEVLLNEARNSDESLYKIIHLDKTLFEVDWVRKRIRKAFYSGDSRFFKQLGSAIKKPLIPAKLMYGEAIIILKLLWSLGLKRLDNRELMELLKMSGVMIPEEPDTFRKFIDRLKNDNVIKDV